MTTIYNQDEINKILWDICDTFKRQTNAEKNYLEYISAILYIIYFNKTNFNKMYDMRNYYYIADNIDLLIEEIRKETNNKYLFHNIRFKELIVYRGIGEENVISETIERIYVLIKKIESRGVNINSREFIATAYQHVLRQVFDREDIVRNNGEIYTPTGVAKIMIGLAVRNKGTTIGDLYCGSGNILVNLKENKNIRLFGREENIDAYNLCMTNLMLNDVDNSNIELHNFRDSDFSRRHYDCIVSNPPFFSKKLKNTLYNNSEETKMNGDYTYLLSSLKTLKDGGTMAFVLPHGVLFRTTERAERKKLINENNIDAIIGLPENLFYGTRISVILMILKKNRTSKDILFIDASDNYTKKRRINIIDKYNQNKIIDIYNKREEIQGYSYLAKQDEIINNNYDLTIKKYVKRKIVKENIQKKTIINKLELLDKEKNILEENIKDVLERLDIKDVFTKYTKKENIYDIDYEKIGKNIRKTRKEKECTIEKLAEELDVSVAFLSRVERGMVKLSLDRLSQICKLLEVSIDEILRD